MTNGQPNYSKDKAKRLLDIVQTLVMERLSEQQRLIQDGAHETPEFDELSQWGDVLAKIENRLLFFVTGMNPPEGR